MWTEPRKVRDIVGFDDDAAVGDRELEEIIRIAQEHVKNELFTYHYDETVNGNPDTGATWDGSNTTYQTQYYPIQDSDYDFTVTGNTDVAGRWIDSTWTPQMANVTVSNVTYGILTICQSGGSTAIPSSAKTVKIDYYTCHRNLTRPILEDLTSYMAAHLVQGRLKTGTSISLADIQKNRMLIMKEPTEYLRIYRLMVSKVEGAVITGA